MTYLTKKEYATFRKLEEALRTELNSGSDAENARQKAKEILGYAPYRRPGLNR